MKKMYAVLIILLGLTGTLAAGLHFGMTSAAKNEVKNLDLKVREKMEEEIAASNHAPTLSWTGETNYVSDGLNPESGTSATTFTYRIKYTDADGDAPATGYPKVHIKKGGAEISGSPFTMTKISGDYITGAIYSYSATLSTGINYTYYFEAQDSKGGIASGTPTTAIDAPDVSIPVNQAPTLSWTGESNYISDGLNPEMGTSAMTFTYRVKYTDVDGDAPMSGYPKVCIKKSGAEISGSPFAMTKISGDYLTGWIYSYSTVLSTGTNYTYYFEAQDSKGGIASGTPTIAIDAPDVSIPWSVPKYPVGLNVYADEVAIAADSSNNVYIVYWAHNGSFSNLQYTKWNGALWSAPVILDTVLSNAPSIAVDSGENVHIVYATTANTILKYILLTPAGTFATYTVSGSGTVGKPEIAVDSSGIPHIICDYSGLGLIHIWDSSHWYYDVIDANVSYQKVGMAIDASNNVHVSYPSNNGQALSYCKRVGGTWQAVETVNANTSCLYSSLAVDTAGNPRIAYQHIAPCNLEYANKLSGLWVSAILDSTPYWACFFPSLVVDSDGTPHIVYWQGYSYDVLMYATKTGSPIIVDDTHSGGTSTAIALDSTGGLHVAYANGTNLYYVERK